MFFFKEFLYSIDTERNSHFGSLHCLINVGRFGQWGAGMESRMSQWDTLTAEFQQHSKIYRPAAILNSQRDGSPKETENKRQKSRRQNF